MAETLESIAGLFGFGDKQPNQPARFAEVSTVSGDTVAVTVGASTVDAVRCCACSAGDVVLLETLPNGTLAAVAVKGYQGGGGSIETVTTYYAAGSSTAPLPPDTPAGISAVEYVQTDGTAWIDTGVLPALDFEVKAKVLQATSGDRYFIGARKDSGNTRFYPIHIYSGEYLTVTGQWANYPGVTPANTYTVPHVVDAIIENGTSLTITVDGVTDTGTGTATESTLPTVTLPIFGAKLNNGGSIAPSPSGTRCYYAKLYRDGELVRDFVPATDYANAAGFYDLVSRTFFGKSSQYGTLTAGPVVSSAWSTEAPLLSDATPYLWAYQVYEFSDGTTYTTPAYIAGRYENGRTESSGGVQLSAYGLELGSGTWPTDGGYGWQETKYDDGRLDVYYWQSFATTGNGWQQLWTNLPYPTDATAFISTPAPAVSLFDNGASVQGAAMVKLTSIRTASDTTGFKMTYYNSAANTNARTLVIVHLSGRWA